jgi:hypothetical protein
MFSLVKRRIKFVHPNIAEILLKLVLNTNQSINQSYFCFDYPDCNSIFRCLYFTTSLYFSGAFVTMFSVAYLLSPRFCHRFVGYLEEEAVVTYSKCVEVSRLIVNSE